MKKTFSTMVHSILSMYPDARNNYENFRSIWDSIAFPRWGVDPNSVKTTTKLRTWARHKKSF